MHKVKTQRFGKLFVKNLFIIYFHMVIIKTYKVEKILKKLPPMNLYTNKDSLTYGSRNF